jgi:ribonuclease E
MKKEMLINVSQPEECRIAILEDGVLEELYTERASQNNFAGNIYKGKIVNLEPSIQAAFVDFGVGRNGFLHISDVEPQYFRQAGYDPDEIMEGNIPGADIDDGNEEEEEEDLENGGKRREAGKRPDRNDRGRRRNGGRAGHSTRPRFKPPIQEIFRRGDEVLVQVIKEGNWHQRSNAVHLHQHPRSLLGVDACLGTSRRVSAKSKMNFNANAIASISARFAIHLRALGFIVRTAGQDRTRKELSRDMAYLLRLWKVIVKRLKNQRTRKHIYEESDMIIRTIRDIFTKTSIRLMSIKKDSFKRAKEFLQLVMPRYVNRIQLVRQGEPSSTSTTWKKRSNRIQRRTVPLKGGGSIVIDPTEALVAIDVNSGIFRTDDSAEENAFQLNLSAAKEIARQLRLRDLGGVIVNDFIDMRKETHRRKVERVSARIAMRRDRARTKILRTSPFGLIEMTRQRIRPSLKRSCIR